MIFSFNELANFNENPYNFDFSEYNLDNLPHNLIKDIMYNKDIPILNWLYDIHNLSFNNKNMLNYFWEANINKNLDIIKWIYFKHNNIIDLYYLNYNKSPLNLIFSDNCCNDKHKEKQLLEIIQWYKQIYGEKYININFNHIVETKKVIIYLLKKNYTNILEYLQIDERIKTFLQFNLNLRDLLTGLNDSLSEKTLA